MTIQPLLGGLPLSLRSRRAPVARAARQLRGARGEGEAAVQGQAWDRGGAPRVASVWETLCVAEAAVEASALPAAAWWGQKGQGGAGEKPAQGTASEAQLRLRLPLVSPSGQTEQPAHLATAARGWRRSAARACPR